MATIKQEKNNTYTLRLTINGRQIRFMGFTNRREAQRAGEHIEELNHAKKTGFRPPAYVEEWLNKLGNSALHRRLIKLGLTPENHEHTLTDLIKSYHDSLTNVVDSTWENYVSAFNNLIRYFGQDAIIENITIEQAAEFGHWIRTEPLNSRTNRPVPLSSATASRRICTTRQLFTHAIRMGWIVRNPFNQIKAGISANPDKLAYIPVKDVLSMMDGIPPYWRLILGLGRFCGLRGSSELYLMEWRDIHFKTENEPGWLFVHAVKNKHNGRYGRRVPLPLIMEQLFLEYKKTVESNRRVFPKMAKETNFSIMTRKFLNDSGLPDYPNPWYNLRKSFCSDLLEQIQDISAYEHITDHSYKVAAKHYQILHKGRLLKTITGINCFDCLENVLPPAKNSAWKTSLQSTTDSGKLNAEPVKKDTKRNKKASSASDCRDAVWALLNSKKIDLNALFSESNLYSDDSLAYFSSYLLKMLQNDENMDKIDTSTLNILLLKFLLETNRPR